MAGYFTDYDPPDHLSVIVGCRLVNGCCVRHQPREWEPRKVGCPLVDQIKREGKSR